MVTYSQNQEQIKIIEYFNKYYKDLKGSFCSIGENDGETLSNVRALALLGWKGVCIEPSPRAYARLKNLYDGSKEVYTYNFAIGTHNGRMKFFESGTHLNKGDVGLLSTSNDKEMTRFPGTQYEEMEVKCFRWKTALNRFTIKKFDFISIDAEGLDMDILEQMELEETKCICIEWNGNQDLRQKFSEYLKGFHIIYVSRENLIFVRR